VPARGPGKAGGGGGGARPVGDQDDSGGMGGRGEQRGGGEVEGEADVWAPHVCEGRERSSRGILDHTKIHESASGSKSIKDV
jgi:hypothetical protein